jgi:aryl-alcohol dehydrogenase-like predicted oxidoreductase
MKYRNLGSLEVSVLGLGRVAVTGSYAAPVDRTDMIRLIHEAYGRDVNFLRHRRCLAESEINLVYRP